MNKYAWNDAMILDKIQEVLDIENIDDMDITPENLEKIKDLLSENISTEDINNSASILAESIDELKTTSKQDIKDYISRLINYLNENNLNSIIGEYEGIEFEVFKNSTVEEVFKNYYDKYDETYGISNMLSDLGLK
nr:hypothetical protein [uncultured Terrisporobacter sp.]